jgi:endonuclease YncB( thermonuclease family)
MSALVFGKDVELRSHTIDRYGHLVWTVFVDGADAGLELINKELAPTNHIWPEASPEIQAQAARAWPIKSTTHSSLGANAGTKPSGCCVSD